MVTLSHAELRLRVGDRVPAAIEIANPGEVDDEYVVEVGGEAAQWTSVEPGKLALAAGAAGTVQVWFRPVAPASAGALVPFEVRVTSRQLPDQPVVLTGAVEVEAAEPPPSAALEPPLPPAPDPGPPSAPEPPPPTAREPPPTYSRYRRRSGPGLILAVMILVIGVVLLFGASAAQDEGDTELADAMSGAGWLLIVIAVVAGVIWLVVSRAGRR